MTVSYLDTIAAIAEAEGLRYGKITRAMRVHVRSLVADGYAMSFTDDGVPLSLDDPEGIIWFTSLGGDYVDTLRSAGLIAEPREQAEPQEAKPRTARKPRRRRTAKPSAAEQRRMSKEVAKTLTVPSPTESVKVTTVPPSKKGPQPTAAAVEVPALGATNPVETVTVGDRMAALEALVEGLANSILSGSLR